MVEGFPGGKGPGSAGARAPAELVLFRSGERRWALPLASVERVTAMVAIAPLPGAPAGVRGAVDVHGDVLPVLDLGVRLGGAPHRLGSEGQLVLARTARRRVALPVDESLGVAAVPLHPATAPFAGVAQPPDGLLAVYDLDAFLAAGEEDELTRALLEASG
jgi:purine-binding chemotaxis protein CheW